MATHKHAQASAHSRANDTCIQLTATAAASRIAHLASCSWADRMSRSVAARGCPAATATTTCGTKTGGNDELNCSNAPVLCALQQPRRGVVKCKGRSSDGLWLLHMVCFHVSTACTWYTPLHSTSHGASIACMWFQQVWPQHC